MAGNVRSYTQGNIPVNVKVKLRFFKVHYLLKISDDFNFRQKSVRKKKKKIRPKFLSIRNFKLPKYLQYNVQYLTFK